MVNKEIKRNCLFLSPHLDDAVLSCGGFLSSLAQKGHKINIVNIFTEASLGKVPEAAKTYLQECSCQYLDSRSFFEMRRKEDLEALSSLAIKPENLGFIDASWRKDKEGKSLYKEAVDVFTGLINQKDESLIKTIKNIIEKKYLPESNKKNTTLFVPLGVGGHVDHLITKIIGESLEISQVIYWEDVPYNNKSVNSFFEKNLYFQKIIEYQNNFQLKRKMIKEYTSQYSYLFPSGIRLKKESFYQKKIIDDLKFPSFSVLNIPISISDLEIACDVITFWAENKKRKVIFACSMNDLMQSRKIEQVKKSLINADLVTPDGMPLVWLGQKIYHKKVSRVYGPELMNKILARTEGKPIRHFFYGGDKKTLGLLIKKIKNKYPEVLIAGYFSPPFRELTKEEDKMILKKIEDSQADLIWVGLGVPKQNLFIHNFSHRVSPKIWLGVGAAFDFLAETKKQAPIWMRQTGLEWLFRLYSEPKRLWRRYLLQIPCFVFLISIELIKKLLTEKKK